MNLVNKKRQTIKNSYQKRQSSIESNHDIPLNPSKENFSQPNVKNLNDTQQTENRNLDTIMNT